MSEHELAGGDELLKEVSNLKKFLETGLKGQPKAIETVCKMYEFHLTMRQFEERPGPIMTVLCLGPSGSGKTELARQLAKYFWNNVDAFVKIDCANFSERHTISKLIGSPPGYIGYEDEPIFSQEYIDQRVGTPKETAAQDDDTTPEQEAIITRIIDTRKKLKDLKEHQDEILEWLESLKESLKIDREIREQALGFTQADSKYPKDPAEKKLLEEAKYPDLKRKLEVIRLLDNELHEIVELFEELHINLAYERTELQKTFRTKPKQKTKKMVQKKPFIVLLDELEKGHEALHDLLLSIMEDGRVVLARGRGTKRDGTPKTTVTDFTNAIILATSNVGARQISEILKEDNIGFYAPNQTTPQNTEGYAKRTHEVGERELKKVFKPEFRRRLDAVITFRPLTRETLLEILDLEIEKFTIALRKFDLWLDIGPEVKQIILQESLDHPDLGAGLLRHKFKTIIKIPLGRRLAHIPGLKGSICITRKNDGTLGFYRNQPSQ